MAGSEIVVVELFVHSLVSMTTLVDVVLVSVVVVSEVLAALDFDPPALAHVEKCSVFVELVAEIVAALPKWVQR